MHRCQFLKNLLLLTETIERKLQIEKHPQLSEWEKIARPNQREPKGQWNTWLILAGRGFGKTRTGAETIQKWVRESCARMIALVGQTDGDVERVMIGGPSGLQSIAPDALYPHYYKSKKKLVWPNGAYALVMSDAAYERLRGPHFDAAWVDELAKFKNAQETWDQLQFSLRLGKSPRIIVTTTPKPIALLKKLIQQSDVVVTKGSTLENAQNLSESFIKSIVSTYENTRLGKQEIYAEILGSDESRLWTKDMIVKVSHSDIPLSFRKCIIALDPAVTFHEDSDETGIIIIGLSYQKTAWVLEDLTCKASPALWAEKVIQAYKRYKAHEVIVETNNGGDVIPNLLRTYHSDLKVKSVRTQSNKIARAQPVAALYEQGRVFHVERGLEALEQQMLDFPDQTAHSPDRVDALVWGLSYLFFMDRQQQTAGTIWPL